MKALAAEVASRFNLSGFLGSALPALGSIHTQASFISGNIMKRIVIVNGPNLDRLGVREPSIYGNETLTDLVNRLTEVAGTLGVEAQFYQSNHEGFIIDEINNEFADGNVFGLIVNPGNAAGFARLPCRSRSAW